MDPGSSLALTPLEVVPLPVTARAPGAISRIPQAGAFIGPGRTLHELYTTLGTTAERHANRAAHSLGLGPVAVTARIKLFFGEGVDREAALSRLRQATPRKLEKDCARLVQYAFPSEASNTQLEAFKSLVALSTSYPGVRHLFLNCIDIKLVQPLEAEITALWDRPNDSCDENWHFNRNFAAACLADRDISFLVEDIGPEHLDSVITPRGGLSIIERLLVASDCEGSSTFSRPIAVRYLGGILQMPSFWLQNGTIYRGVLQKLLARASTLLKDLGVDSPGPQESPPRLQCDVDGVEIFCDALLTGIYAWFPDTTSPATKHESWYPTLCVVLKLLRYPQSEDLLPKSAAIATAPKFRELVATVAESQIVKTLSDVPLHAHKSSFKKSKQPQGKAFSDSPARKTAKILLLGSADSGKSTLLKQMRIIYSVPFSSHEIESYRQLVFDNLGLGIQPLLESLSDFGLSLPHALLPAAKIVQSERDLRFGEPFPKQWLGAITRLWNDSIVQEAFRRGGEHALLENMSYLCADLPRLFSPSFVPTNRDILHLRARTIGITETDIPYGIGAPVIDVGGARSERRKWIHVFEDLIKVIIFTVSLSGYDRVLIEDSLRNQMQDAMQLWDSICHSRYFERTPIILCFTKNDLFEQEVLRSNIVDFFPDFQGARGDAVAGRDYFIKRFRSLAKPKDDVFIHAVTATDTETMRGLLESVGAFLPSS